MAWYSHGLDETAGCGYSAHVIGVAASPTDLRFAAEFFELFKTPWEPIVPGRRYPVILTTVANAEDHDTELLLVYSASELAIDRDTTAPVQRIDGPVAAIWDRFTFPIYGRVARFDDRCGEPALTLDGACIAYRRQAGQRTMLRIGYDLFREVQHLLGEGQPTDYAPTPTLELHIAFLRHVLRDSGVSFVEIPPQPHGFDFACCLTHDLDFHGIRRHRLDRTLAGFVARASFGTLADLVRGRRSLTEAVRNWLALLTLPLVFIGLAPDPWNPFEAYARADGGRRSTFFLAPFKGLAGVSPNGEIEPRRAIAYQASEIREPASRAVDRGSELGVHGIDAWRDPEAGRAEMREVTALTSRQTAGVRMHWLYFDAESPRRLEAAGYEYDATWGYNDAVGYRAGTSQVFRWPASDDLLELPMSIMDTALLYPRRMGLSQTEALRRCAQMVANARRFGGTLVINWHDRSLAPERQWGRVYRGLLAEVERDSRVWFATAAEVVAWYRWRRSMRFTWESRSGAVTVAATAPRPTVPAATIQCHRAHATAIEQQCFDGGEPTRLTL